MSTWHAPLSSDRPRFRLICIPFAGGGTGIYRSWPSVVPEGVEIVPIELPGRERRLKEPAFSSMPALLEALVPAVRPLMDVPWGIFGHSMGAAISYELARAATAAGVPPELIFLSARRAPQLDPPHPPLFALPKEQLLAEVERLYGPLPEAIKKFPSLLDMFMPTMRADFQLLDTWKAPLDCVLDAPIIGFAAEEDHAVLPDTIDRWGELTRGRYRKFIVPGGHFCVRDRTEVRDHVARELRRHTA